VTPLLRVVLIFGNLIIMCIETKTGNGPVLFQKEAFFFRNRGEIISCSGIFKCRQPMCALNYMMGLQRYENGNYEMAHSGQR
jgi:hypothetical protein